MERPYSAPMNAELWDTTLALETNMSLSFIQLYYGLQRPTHCSVGRPGRRAAARPDHRPPAGPWPAGQTRSGPPPPRRHRPRRSDRSPGGERSRSDCLEQVRGQGHLHSGDTALGAQTGHLQTRGQGQTEWREAETTVVPFARDYRANGYKQDSASSYQRNSCRPNLVNLSMMNNMYRMIPITAKIGV